MHHNFSSCQHQLKFCILTSESIPCLLLSITPLPPPGLPVPFTPRVTLCLADPIEVEAVKGVKGDDGKVTIPQEAIEELHEKYIKSITEMFNKYKEAAGYPDAVLEVQ